MSNHYKDCMHCFYEKQLFKKNDSEKDERYSSTNNIGKPMDHIHENEKLIVVECMLSM